MDFFPPFSTILFAMPILWSPRPLMLLLGGGCCYVRHLKGGSHCVTSSLRPLLVPSSVQSFLYGKISSLVHKNDVTSLAVGRDGTGSRWESIRVDASLLHVHEGSESLFQLQMNIGGTVETSRTTRTHSVPAKCQHKFRIDLKIPSSGTKKWAVLRHATLAVSWKWGIDTSLAMRTLPNLRVWQTFFSDWLATEAQYLVLAVQWRHYRWPLLLAEAWKKSWPLSTYMTSLYLDLDAG